MAHRFEGKYPHRHNRDGSYDSICTTCFATIDTQASEPALDMAERSHVCDPYDLANRVLQWTLHGSEETRRWRSTSIIETIGTPKSDSSTELISQSILKQGSRGTTS